MASCNWQKIKTPQEAKALLRHCITDERMKVQHSNQQIDKNRTHLNVSFGSMGDYEMSASLYEKRIAELDKMGCANKRKDRVTLIGLNIPQPDGLAPHLSHQWFRSVYEKLNAHFGDENIVGGVVHFDEIHEYIDAETGEKRQSRPHMHVYVIPVVNGKLNAKQVMSRKNMVTLNDEVEKISYSYGCKFLTGTKRKSTKSVEELKNESQHLAAQQEAQRIVEDAQKRSEAILSEAMHQAELIRKRAENEAQSVSETLARVRVLHSDSLRFRNECEERASKARNNSSLEAFCQKLKYRDGKTVLDAYNEKRAADNAETKRLEDYAKQLAKQYDMLHGQQNLDGLER